MREDDGGSGLIEMVDSLLLANGWEWRTRRRRRAVRRKGREGKETADCVKSVLKNLFLGPPVSAR